DEVRVCLAGGLAVGNAARVRRGLRRRAVRHREVAERLARVGAAVLAAERACVAAVLGRRRPRGRRVEVAAAEVVVPGVASAAAAADFEDGAHLHADVAGVVLGVRAGAVLHDRIAVAFARRGVAGTGGGRGRWGGGGLGRSEGWRWRWN